MKRFISILIVALMTCAVCSAQSRKVSFDSPDCAPLFPFTIEKGAPDNITNVQTWAKHTAGQDGFLRIENGQFVSNRGSVRFVGTNLCFSASFPNSKADAEQLAASLSRFGINCVRIHHADSAEIWGGWNCKNHTDISPEQLDKLDYLIYQLHQHGIYVNINLHVSRQFDQKDGMVTGNGVPDNDKGLDNFQPKMIQLQKKYAKDLLTHVNPYLKKAYVNDPGVAMIEINNENSVVASWSWGQLDNLPEPYCSDFQKCWNDWLKKKYSSTEAIKTAWNCKSFPLGEQMIPDGNFPFQQLQQWNQKGWELQTDADCKATTSVYACKDTPIDGRNVLKIQVEKRGAVNWIPQLHRNGLKITENTPYTFGVKCRASQPTTINASLVENHNPWGRIGFSNQIKLTDQWQTLEYSFIADKTDNEVRITFNGFSSGISYEFADVSLIPGGEIGLKSDQKLESGSIPVPHKSNSTFPSQRAKADFVDFLYDLENTYWQDMYMYVKSLGARQPITGTQLQYGFWYNQANLDYCDIHAYWNHPSFPGRPWDGNNWTVGSKALVNSPADKWATLNRLAAVRVFDRPLTVSEYDHPFPNPYCAEGNVMAFSFAAFQNWSGVFQFAWKHNNDYSNPICNSFFDMASNVGKTAHLPACYAMFVLSDVKSGDFSIVHAPRMNAAKEKLLMTDNLSGYHRNLDGLKIDYSLPLAVPAGVRLSELKPSKKSNPVPIKTMVKTWSDVPEDCGSLEKKWIRSQTGQLYYDFQVPEKGFFTVNSPKVKVFSGFVNGRSFDLGDVTLVPGKTRQDWLTYSQVQVDSNRYLITATGLIINTDMDLVDLGGNKWTCGNRWGKAPTLCEGVPALVKMKLAPEKINANKIKVYALKENGARGESVPFKIQNDTLVLNLSPLYKTIWYEIVL